MSKELKAFRKICKNLNSYEFTDEYEKNKKLIEKALERKEKSEKALEIIKENALYVDWTWLFDCVVNNKSYEDYIEGCNAMKETTFADKEEYDLLREVLEK